MIATAATVTKNGQAVKVVAQVLDEDMQIREVKYRH